MNKSKKILASLVLVSLVVIALVAGSAAFFSDSETSKNNVLQAGALDLLIDNHSWYYGPEGLVYRDDLSWEATNLDGHLFFNYDDLKPGDWGEDTISVRVDDNPAWACVDLYVTRNDDMSSTDPELDVDVEEDSNNIWDGELADELQFFFWVDDGDNVYESDETVLTYGPASAALSGLHYTLADSRENNMGGQVGDALTGDATYYIGKFWCYGELTSVPAVPGDGDVDARFPDVGFTCNGAPVTNVSQTDRVMADVSFYAVQQRHNETFVCEQQYTPYTTLNLENKDASWNEVLGDGISGTLVFKTESPTFDYNLEVYGLQAGTDYLLHYYADPWASINGIAIASFTTDASGNWAGNGSVELNTDLPVAGDLNAPNAKVWVIPASHWGGTGVGMTTYDRTQYLFEHNLVQYDDTDL